ncbi:MAG: thioredoxin-disulfide reductase [Elusimicrobiales bacterium]|nr:thioredoxin-disulfide reductase [Elusimicrobiales bacterium]HOJ86050.1 thioredoxin-disulfide reductase [Elusimicrobiales bacterium]HOL62664.1 thioredoxin-disulfide reductase [Elusimicrobiales bacterium]HPO95230.1 thioredoxin-disulfide reductase [Elusimicrobiales bacterium]
MENFDIIIIGSGPAGITASIYGSRAGLKTLVIAGPAPGGQLLQTMDIENFPGFEHPISGFDLMTKMINQSKRLGTKIINEFAKELDLSKTPFTVKTGANIYQTKSVIIATGANAKWLGLESEQRLIGRGVSSCATCDGFFYKGKTVCVIGGGDSACEEAIFLTNFAQKVYLIHRRDQLRAAYIMQEKVKKNPKIEIIYDHIPSEIIGENKVSGIKIKNVKTQEEKKIDLDGVFIAIGHHPNSEIVKGKVKLDDHGYIVVDSNFQTSVPGVFACGDVADTIYKQAIVASGTGCMAAMNAIKFVESV